MSNKPTRPCDTIIFPSINEYMKAMSSMQLQTLKPIDEWDISYVQNNIDFSLFVWYASLRRLFTDGHINSTNFNEYHDSYKRILCDQLITKYDKQVFEKLYDYAFLTCVKEYFNNAAVVNAYITVVYGAKINEVKVAIGEAIESFSGNWIIDAFDEQRKRSIIKYISIKFEHDLLPVNISDIYESILRNIAKLDLALVKEHDNWSVSDNH